MSERVVGELTLSEMRSLEQLRADAEKLILEVGRCELRKQQLVERLREHELAAHAVMADAARRLGIESGVAWQVAPDGRVVVHVG